MGFQAAVDRAAVAARVEISDSMILNETDHARVASAIDAAEKRSAAEIVCMISPAASEYRFTPVLWASVLALFLPWPLWWFTQVEVSRILLAQLVLFCVLIFVFSYRRVRIRLTPKAIRRADVERAAERQFNLMGIARTKHRSGVLLYISVAERVAIVLPDEAVRKVLTIAATEGALAAMTAKLKHGQAADAFIAAIDILGTKLAELLPPLEANANELSNAVIEL